MFDFHHAEAGAGYQTYSLTDGLRMHSTVEAAKPSHRARLSMCRVMSSVEEAADWSGTASRGCPDDGRACQRIAAPWHEAFALSFIM